MDDYKATMMDGHRLKRLRISDEALLEYLDGGWQSGTLISGLPEDHKLIRTYLVPEKMAIDFVIWSGSYPALADGCDIPLIEEVLLGRYLCC